MIYFFTDYERDRYILCDDLPIAWKLNNGPVTLKLLTIFKVVGLLDRYIYDTSPVINKLPLPSCIILEIENEIHYQRDIYFNKIIEPTITYKYPNEF